MKDKIIQLMKSEGLTSSRLAEILEIQPSGVSHIVSGRNKPGFDLLQKILKRFPQVNPDWLLLDAPNIYRDKSVEPSDYELVGETNDFPSLDLFDVGLSQSSNIGEERDRKTGAIQRDNRAQITGQKSPQNESQKKAQFQSSQPSVERIVVLYSDGTFRTYDMR